MFVIGGFYVSFRAFELLYRSWGMFVNGLFVVERKWKYYSIKLYFYVKKFLIIISFNDIDLVFIFIIFIFSELLILEKLIFFLKN